MTARTRRIAPELACYAATGTTRDRQREPSEHHEVGVQLDAFDVAYPQEREAYVGLAE
jgi:hypothetical protein